MIRRLQTFSSTVKSSNPDIISTLAAVQREFDNVYKGLDQSEVSVDAASGLTMKDSVIGAKTANGSQTGMLSAADWSRFDKSASLPPNTITAQNIADWTSTFNLVTVGLSDWNAAYAHSIDVSGNVHGATSADTANMIVRRGASGEISVGTITSSAITVSTVLYANASQQITSITNGAGWLHNDGIGGMAYSTPTKGDVGLGLVENTALSTWAGTSNITTLGTITTGIWHGTAIGDTYISSAATWNAKQAAYANLSSIGALANAAGWLHNDGAGAFSYSTPPAPGPGTVTLAMMADLAHGTWIGRHSAGTGVPEAVSTSDLKSDLALNSVENTALSTWPGTTNVITLGTITTGVWHGSAIGDTYISSAATWTAKQVAYTNLTTIGSLANAAGWLHNDGAGAFAYSTPSKTDVGLSAVENTALSTWAGTSNIITLGTITTGVWHGTAIGDTYISSAAAWTAKQVAYTNLTTIGALANGAGWLHNDGAGAFAYSTPSKTDVGLSAVENTALSTWAGSANVITLGTVTTGVWHGTAIADTYISSAATWTAKQVAYANLTTIGALANGAGWLHNDGAGVFAYSTPTPAAGSITLAMMADLANGTWIGRHSAGTGVPEAVSTANLKSDLSLNNVENTALSTWAGTTNITTIGTQTHNLLFTDATYDIGAAAATRPRDLYLSRNAVIGGVLSAYDGITPTGNGAFNVLGMVLPIYYYGIANASAVAQFNVTNTNVSGMYRVSLYLLCSTVGGGTLTVTWGWTDQRGARTMTTDTIVCTVGVYQDYIHVFSAGYSSTYLTCTVSRTGTGAADVYFVCERLA